MTLLYFSWVRQAIGTGEEVVALPPGVHDVQGLMAHLQSLGANYRHGLGDGARLRVAVNQRHAGFDAVDCRMTKSPSFRPSPEAEMRLRIAVQAQLFDLAAEIAALSGDGASGAVASFTGHVRGDGELSSLSLEHYPGMTEAEIGRAAQDAARRWALTGITIIHRIGRLKPGEAIVLVAAAAAHRGEAFAACEFLADHLKTSAPFWKEEERGGERRWVEARDSDDAALSRWKP